MKKALLAVTVIVLSTVHSQAETKVTDTITVYEEVLPDVFVLPLSVEVRADEEGTVLKTLSAVDEAMRKLGLKYSGGNYSIWEDRFWNSKEKRYERNGFVGRIHYRFLLKKPEAQSSVYDALERLRKNYRFAYSVSSPHWEISGEKSEAVKENLKRSLLSAAKREAQLLSDSLEKSCSISEVDFSQRTFYPVYREKTLLRTETAPPLSRREESKLSVSARVKFICK